MRLQERSETLRGMENEGNERRGQKKNKTTEEEKERKREREERRGQAGTLQDRSEQTGPWEMRAGWRRECFEAKAGGWVCW